MYATQKLIVEIFWKLNFYHGTVNQSWSILDLLSRAGSLFTSTVHLQFNHHLGIEFYFIWNHEPTSCISRYQKSPMFSFIFWTPYWSITNLTCTPPKLNMEPEHHPLQKKKHIFQTHNFRLQTSSFSRRFWYPSPTLPPEDSDPSVRPDFQLLEEELRRLWSSATLPWAAPKFLHPKKTSKGRNGLPFF